MRILLSVFLLGGLAVAQQPAAEPAQPPAPPQQAAEERATVTVPAGTKVLLALRNPITTKTAREGDGVYLQSTFPVTLGNKMVIPPGTYVQGVITKITRPGRVKGRAQLLMHFKTMIFPNGYTVSLPGALDSMSGAEDARVNDQEGTIQAEGSKGKDAATIATTTAAGASIGSIGGVSSGNSGRGLAYGGLAGAAIGTVATLFTRGNDIRIESGTAVEMVLQSPLVLQEERIESGGAYYVPAPEQPRRPALVERERRQLPTPGMPLPFPN